MKKHHVSLSYGFWEGEDGEFCDLYEPSCEMYCSDKQCCGYVYGYEYAAQEMHGRCKYMHSFYNFCNNKKILLEVFRSILKRLNRIVKIYEKYKPKVKIDKTMNFDIHLRTPEEAKNKKRFKIGCECCVREGNDWVTCPLYEEKNNTLFYDCVYYDDSWCKNKTIFYVGLLQMIEEVKSFIRYYEELDDDLREYRKIEEMVKKYRK